MGADGKTPEMRAKWISHLPLWIVLAFTACIAGRSLTFPINRDEHMFVTAAQQLPQGDLYRDLGYTHLPNLALLFSAIFEASGTEHFLLSARLVVIASWAFALLVLWRIGLRLGASTLAVVTSMALLACNITLLGPPGMLATNSFLPIPFAFLAFYFLLGALSPDLPRRRRFAEAFLAGVTTSIAIGLKANFIIMAPGVFLACLLAARSQPLMERIRLQCLPLGIGGILGGLPSILALARDAEATIAHTVSYFTVLHTSFWGDSDEPKVMSINGKLLLAEEVWLGGTTMLAAVGILVFAFRSYRGGGGEGVRQVLFRWPVLLAGSLALCGVAVSFVPTPSFPQYFVPPIPFLILTFLALCPAAPGVPRTEYPILSALLVTALIAGSLRLIPGLVDLARPGSWTGLKTNRVMNAALDDANVAPDARIATMSPVLALEGGRQIYSEFAAGQFVYRVAPYMTQAVRQYYRTTSPAELTRFLDASPPDAILVDTSETIESTLVDYARSRGMREVPVDRTIGSPRFRLFVPASRHTAPEGRPNSQ
ncbi:hypothetical protein [Allopontixanthobacter sediminis]|uniref:Glycosyltransferase RgtA/B/C/D-like domain-containing protein n=1 Tax=Allopontixanthobacter sediminis TaxID=1689985 RepID=A0A845AXT3_9SPHN|nr:hypothetical protein [Allopontixanthobacter sediminis]MXP44323.1 hypothetical protein [Allopontixanthobacter sediminis]